jgi:putative membrane protein
VQGGYKLKLLIRWAGTAFALFVAAWLLDGIYVDGSGWVVYAAMAAILGIVNAVIRPMLKLLTCPLIMLTLGLFTLVINALTLLLAGWIANNWFGVEFYVTGFWAALLGSLIVSVVSVVLSVFVKDDEDEDRRRKKKD